MEENGEKKHIEYCTLNFNSFIFIYQMHKLKFSLASLQLTVRATHGRRAPGIEYSSLLSPVCV